MEYITATINEAGDVTLSSDTLGNVGEHNSTSLRFTVPAVHESEVYYYRLWTDGQFSEKLYRSENTGFIYFDVPQAMLKPPAVRMQLVGYKSVENMITYVWKSKVFKLGVEISVDTVNFIPTKAYDPLEEALLECSSAVNDMHRIVGGLKVSHDELKQVRDLVTIDRQYTEGLANEAYQNLTDTEVIKADCEAIKNDCISYGISKVTTPEGMDENENPSTVATSDAVKAYINNVRTELYNKLGARLTLNGDMIHLVSSADAPEKPNSSLSYINLSLYAKKNQLPTNLSDLQNDCGFITANDILNVRNTITDGNLAVVNNAEYVGTNINTLNITYPDGDFECWLRLTFAKSGDITVTFPTSQYIGDTPNFSNGETWEISIKDGIIISQKAGA